MLIQILEYKSCPDLTGVIVMGQLGKAKSSLLGLNHILYFLFTSHALDKKFPWCFASTLTYFGPCQQR